MISALYVPKINTLDIGIRFDNKAPYHKQILLVGREILVDSFVLRSSSSLYIKQVVLDELLSYIDLLI
jgi:hypothetical protein